MNKKAISMTNHRPFAARATAAVLGVAMLFSLSACDTMVPTPEQNSASKTSAPSISEAQEKKIESKILDVLGQADSTKDPSKLGERMEGPELAIRTSQLAVEKGTGKEDAKMEIPKQIRQTVLPVETGWPRFVFTITSTTQDQQSERLLVMNQSSARSNYKLWGLVRLFSGVSLPKFPIPSIGAKQGTIKDTNLAATPQEALTMYADVLQNGDASKSASKFANDQFRSDLKDLTDSVQQGVAANSGSQKQTFTPDVKNAKVMRTADGGDLVVAQIDSVWERSAGEGRQSQPASDAEKTLFGANNTNFTSTMRVTYMNVVAIYIPSASSKAKITAVGAERQPTKVEAI